ncbi:MAG: hypothetical protein KKE20_05835 [Nanoarchaeota archaeon]|nr:hypothetical protein [Nanoarchaeota archaeon]
MSDSTLRVSDSEAEKAVADFLDNNFYNSEDIRDFKRFTSKEDQLKGKDVKFSWSNLKGIIVDEKSQGHYVNKDLPTFAFELEFMTPGGFIAPGWLFNHSYETQYYLLIWIFADKEKDFTKDDIERLECILIKREDIIVYLAKQGMTPDEAKLICPGLRKESVYGAHMKGRFDGFYLYFTGHLSEKPINIVIRKEKLIELAEKVFTVTRSSIQLRDK